MTVIAHRPFFFPAPPPPLAPEDERFAVPGFEPEVFGAALFLPGPGTGFGFLIKKAIIIDRINWNGELTFFASGLPCHPKFC
jgi:hypothetical protein